VRVCGPLGFELPQAEVELPPGEAPLVVVAPSTAHDPAGVLIEASFAALGGMDVRVMASLNGRPRPAALEVPDNARLHDWLSYSRVMADAHLVICHGGHGTVCRALEHGTPLLVCPALGDMAENAMRVQWAGCGLALPGALRGPAAIRSLARELLSEPAYSERAAEIGRWIAANDGAERAANEIERHLGG
jgi:UDP:flavonoid glycosyltransferase YjiC (YdhE family)